MWETRYETGVQPPGGGVTVRMAEEAVRLETSSEGGWPASGGGGEGATGLRVGGRVSCDQRGAARRVLDEHPQSDKRNGAHLGLTPVGVSTHSCSVDPSAGARNSLVVPHAAEAVRKVAQPSARPV